MTYSLPLDVQPLQSRMHVMLNTRQFDAVEIQPAKEAVVECRDFRAVVVRHLPPLVHARADLFNDLLVRLRAPPQHLGVTLDQVAVDGVEVEVHISFLLVDLVTHGDGVLEPPQPGARLALFLIRARGQVVRQDDDGQEERVCHLGGARPQVLNGIVDVRRGRPLDIASRDIGIEGVREHELPATGLPLLAHIRLSMDDF